MEGPVIKKKILFLQLGQKNVREANNGSPLLLFLIFFKEPKIVGKSPLGPLAPLAPLVSAGPGPLYCQSTPFSKSKENMVYILSTLPLYAGVLLKFRIPLCPHCLCLCNKQYEKYGKQRHEKILQKLKTHTKYLKLGARSLRLKNKPQRY